MPTYTCKCFEYDKPGYLAKCIQKLGKTTDVRVVIRNVSCFKCFLSGGEEEGINQYIPQITPNNF